MIKTLISYRKYTYIFSITLVVVSLFSVLRFGLMPGIDFTGGTLMEIGCRADADACVLPEVDHVREVLAQTETRSATVQRTDSNSLILRYVASDESQNELVLAALREIQPQLMQLRVEFVGSSVSSQLKSNAMTAVIVAIVVIAFYIAWAFRKVSFFVSSWSYGISAVIALLHDVLIVIGAFAILGHFYDVEIGVAFIAALLTVLGYSVNDTIVVYDRVRENILRLGKKYKFEELVNRSVRETIARSMNTSMTVIVVLLAVLLFGGATLKYFALALLIGVIAGTYSSIFVASALLVTIYNYKK